MHLLYLFLSSIKAFLETDKFTHEEYKKSEIIAKHNIIFLDIHTFKKGRFNILQSTAEILISLYQTAFNTDGNNKKTN